jgi:hypothetical protein
MPNGERVRTVSRIGPRQARAGVSAVEQLRVFRKKRGPVVGTAPFPLVSILAVGLCDPPEHLLPADDQGDQRCEKKPIPDTEGDDGDGAYGRLLSVATAYSESPSHFPQTATSRAVTGCTFTVAFPPAGLLVRRVVGLADLLDVAQLLELGESIIKLASALGL